MGGGSGETFVEEYASEEWMEEDAWKKMLHNAQSTQSSPSKEELNQSGLSLENTLAPLGGGGDPRVEEDAFKEWTEYDAWKKMLHNAQSTRSTSSKEQLNQSGFSLEKTPVPPGREPGVEEDAFKEWMEEDASKKMLCNVESTQSTLSKDEFNQSGFSLENTLPPSASTTGVGLYPHYITSPFNLHGKSTPTSCSTFQLMEIVSDKQDLSFVQKVQVSEHQISNLCNALSPASATAGKEGKITHLDFNVLDTHSATVVGFYGDKAIMSSIFRKKGLAPSDFVDRMDANRLKHGLYACHNGDGKVYLFYWDGREQAIEASRKDVTCNFVRYLVELCETVYVCLEGKAMEEVAMPCITSVPTRRQRTQRLQIAARQESEDDLKLLNGFRIPLPCNEIHGHPELQLTQGLHRCTVLASVRNARKLVCRQDCKTETADKLKAFLISESVKFSIDCTQLPNKDFLLLLEILGKQEELSQCKKAESTWKQQEEELEKMVRSVGSVIKHKKAELLSAFCSALEFFLACKYSWEESLLVDNKSQGSREKTEVRSGTLARTLVEHEEEVPTAEQNLLAFEGRICSIWNDHESQSHRFLFPGPVEVARVQENGFAPSKVMSISCIDGKATPGPICHWQHVKLTYARGADPDSCQTPCTVYFSPTKAGSAPSAFPLEEPIIMNGETKLMLTTMTGNNKANEFVSIKLVDNGSSGMEAWLNAICNVNRPLALQKQAAAASYLIKRLDGKPLDDKLVEKLIREESFKEWTKLLPNPAASLLVEYLEENKVEAFHDQAAACCTQIYKDARQKLWKGVDAFITKDLCPALEDRVQKNLRQEHERVKRALDVEKETLICKMKTQLFSFSDSAIDGDEKQEFKLLLKSVGCHYASWRTPFWRERKMTIRYMFEELEKETTTWRASEMVPEKADLDELMRAPSSGKIVIPVRSKTADLITLNPRMECLSGVITVKSGEALIFVEATDKSYLHLYHCPRVGVAMGGRNPIKVFKRGLDLWAVDEVSRFMAMYDRKLCSIMIFRFDEAFKNVDWAGVDIQLSQYSGSSNIVWMDLVPGKRELLLLDDQNRFRVCEIAASMMRPRSISLPFPFLKACITPDSSCLIVFTTERASECNQKDKNEDMETAELDSSTDDDASCHPSKVSLMAYVYLLDDSLTFLKCLPIESMDEQCTGQLQVTCKYFGTQMHLVFLSSKDDRTILMSHVLEISSAQQTFQLQKIGHKTSPSSNDHGNEQKPKCSSCPALDFIFHIFDKYAVSPPLCSVNKNVRFCILLNPPYEQWENSRAKRNCEEHVTSSLQKLKEKGKVLTKLLQLHVVIETLDDTWNPGQSYLESSAILDCESNMGEWIQKILCLVPMQIARAENNTLKLLINGLEIPADAAYSDAVSLASLLRFGLYDLVLASWKGEVKVVSSMGKQSSGKSYLLNHLAGGLLDVAGGRCTDGVWMTVRCEPDCLYVLLDFEGLGSFERSEQEDMFLSILNAAVSNVTIFNKKDFHLDKETEAIFQRFQDGVSLVKADEKLFKGLFYMAIKDVDASDVEDLKNEFYAKISHICSKSSENFLTTMYGGEVEIAALPPFQRLEFQESIADIGYTIQEIRASYNNGRHFIEDLKLVMAQISARDWSPIESKRTAMRLSILHKHLEPAIRLGQCCDGQSLLHFDKQEEIKDRPVCIKGIQVDTIPDSGLKLVGHANESRTTQVVLEPLRQEFESYIQRHAGNDEESHEMYQGFLASLVERRKERVLEWLQVNCQDFEQDGDVQKLTLEATAKLADMKSKLVLCSCKCNECFLTCILGKGHQSDHSCLGSHACSQQCTYCVEGQDSGLMVLECNDLAGHDGPHDCKKRAHTCEKPCLFSSKSSNCNKLCSLRVDHDGEHRCNSRQHMCQEKCSLPQCTNACATPIEFEHQRHACHEKFCPVQCSLNGCMRSCVTQDHFHQLEAGVQHFCANEHPCPKKCASPGVCNVLTELLKQTRSFHGKRSEFEYEYVSEQSEERKECCLMIPAFQLHHEGPHTHTTKANAVHYCDQRCPACDYYCQLPIGHAGLHKTVHGNMSRTRFVSEVEEIDVLDRKYARGESGVAEMCNMHCKARGRGHVHVTPCPEVDGSGCCTEKLFDGARHLKIKCSGLDVDVPLDEMTHEAYWQYIRFVDPCEEEEKENFALCDHFCRSDEHDTESSNAGKSYCTEKLWHAPVPRAGGFQTVSGGYVTEDGHHFTCNHSKTMPQSVIFVIDKSGSMDCNDIRPSLAKFAASYQMNRLGCVFEAIIRFIKTRMQATVGLQVKDSVSVVLFDTMGCIGAKFDEICEQVVDKLLHYRADGGTTYSSGLAMVEQILGESSMQPQEYAKAPVVIFLSDGGNNGGNDPVYMVRRMKQNEPRLVLHTIMFGRDPHANLLQQMAQAGNGTFQLSLDEVQLARSFEGLAKSLKPKLAALCSSST